MERTRRLLAIVGMWGGWAGAMGLGVWSVVDYDPNHGDFAPDWVGLAFIFLIGVAIAASSARARQKLSAQIIEAFRIGLTVNGQRLTQQRQGKHASEQPAEHDRSTVDRQ